MVTFYKVLQPGGRSDATRSCDQVGIKLQNFGSKQNKQQSDQLDKNQVLLLQKSSSSNDSYKKKKKRLKIISRKQKEEKNGGKKNIYMLQYIWLSGSEQTLVWIDFHFNDVD